MKAADGIATIWDGEEFRQVSQKEADELVKEDKAQDVSKEFTSALELKFRRDFTGYMTREIRAKPQPQAAPEKAPEPKPASEPEADEKPKKVKASDWMKYRKAAADAKDVPFAKMTKAMTLEYMEKDLGLDI